jgi:hypothetical protein
MKIIEVFERIVGDLGMLYLQYSDGTTTRVFVETFFTPVIRFVKQDDCGRELMDEETSIPLSQFTVAYLKGMLHDGNLESWRLKD